MQAGAGDAGLHGDLGPLESPCPEKNIYKSGESAGNSLLSWGGGYGYIIVLMVF